MIEMMASKIQPQHQLKSFQRLKKIAENLITKDDLKYRALHLNNPKLKHTVLEFDGGIEFLHNLGFEPHATERDWLVCHAVNTRVVQACIICLENKIDVLSDDASPSRIEQLDIANQVSGNNLSSYQSHEHQPRPPQKRRYAIHGPAQDHLDITGIKSCQALLRLINELLRCQNINPTDIHEFSIDATCQRVLNDYIHLVTEHKQDLESIREELATTHTLPNCFANNCRQARRHYEEDDHALDLYTEIMDSLHNYLLHPLHNTRKDSVHHDAHTKKYTAAKFNLFSSTEGAMKGVHFSTRCLESD